MARKFGITVKKNAKPYKSKTKATMTTTWINNAMKSIGMSASKQFKDLTPVMSDTFSTLKSSAIDIRGTAKNASMESVRASIDNNKYIKYGKKAINNALEDLKSGTLNNDNRFMNDDDSKDEYGGWSFGDIDDEEDAGVTINYDGPDESEVVNATYEVNRSINKQTEATLTSSKATIDTLISTSAASLLQSQQMGNEIINHLNSVNSTLSSMQAFQQENTMKMYEILTTFIEKAGPKEETKEYKDNPTDPMNVFSGGKFSASGYKNYLKASIGKAIKSNPHLSLLGLLNDDQMLEALVSNPLGGLSDAIAGKIIPNTLSVVASSLDKAASEFIPTMLARISKLATSNEIGLKGELKRFIGQAFGVKSSITNETSSEGKITKDAATFDKITRNSIIEVIPKYLREGNAYLKTIAEKVDKGSVENNLKNSQVFDTKSGGYVKLSDVNKSITDDLTETIADVFNKSQFGVTLSSAIENLKQEDQEGMDKLMEQLAVLIAEKSGEINGGDLSKGSEMDKILKQLEYSNKNQELLIRSVIGEMNQSRDFGTSLNSYRILAHGAFNEALESYNEADIPNWFSSDYNNNNDIFGTIYKNKGYKKAIKNRKDIEDAEKRLERRKTRKSEKGMKSLNAMSKKDIKTVARDTVNFMANDEANVRANLSDTSADNDILTRTGGHIKNAMWELMFGSSTAAKNEFAEIFTEPMKGLYKSLKKDVFDPFKKSLFGKKDENGVSRDGIFSGLKNSIKDTMSELSHAITGKEYTDTKGNKHDESKNSVHSNIRSMFDTIRKGVSEKLFGKNNEGVDISTGAEKVATKGRGVITGFVNVLGKGLAGWREALFGNDEEMSPEEFKEDTLKKLKEGLPDALTGSLIGASTSALAGGSLLGTLIGGPIGGAVIGFAGGFLKRSEKFQNYLFGEKDEETGERLGGLISRETQEFVKKNKNLIAGGATVGLASSVILGKSGGILGSLVGGPIAGAIMGVGTTFLLRSKTFNDFLFGNEEEGKKGILQAFKGFLKKQSDEGGPSNAKKIGMGAIGVGAGTLTMAAVSKVGLLGFMTGPTGIVGGALIGLGLSIKAQSHNFREWLFGSKEKTESGEKKKAGVVGKISNALTAYLINPIKNKAKYFWQDIKDTVKYDIVEVMRLSISPITNGIANFFKKSKDGASKLFHIFADKFTEKVKPVLNAVIAPIGAAVSKVTDAVYKVANNIVTFPFKLIARVGAAVESAAAKIVKGAFKHIIFPVGKLALNLTKGIFSTLKLGIKLLLTPARLIKRGVKALGSKVAGKIDNKLGGFLSKRRQKKREEKEKRLQELEANGEDTFKTNREKRRLAKDINKSNKKNNKMLSKNQKLIYKWTNGERVLFTEENARIAEANAARAGKKIKWKDYMDEDGKNGFEMTPEERKEKEKAKILAAKSNNDIAGANDADLNIEERQLSVLQRIYNFLLGKTPDGKDPKEKDDEKENTNPEENPEEEKPGILKRLGNLASSSSGVFGRFTNWLGNKVGEYNDVVKSAENAVDNYKFGDIWKFTKRKSSEHKRKRNKEKNLELLYKWTNGEATEFTEENKRLAEYNASKEGVTIHWLDESDESRDATVDQINSENPGIEHYAKGTKHAKKGLAVVGEEKPEIIDFRGGEKVHSDKYKPINVYVGGLSKNAIKNITESINIAEPRSSSHLDPLIEKVKANREETRKKNEEKEKKDAEELKEAQEKGSYQNKHKGEEEEPKATKNPIVSVINKLRGENKKHHKFLSGVLGLFSKKGIIGAGLIALSPFILKYLPTILKTVVDHIPDIINIGKKILSFLGTAASKTIEYFTKDGTESNHTNGKTGFQETTDEIEESINDLKNGDISGYLLNDDGETDSKTSTKINSLAIIPKKLLKTKNAINLVKADANAFEKDSIKHLWNRARYSKFDRTVAQIANTDEVKVVSEGAKSLKNRAATSVKNLASSAKNKAVEVGKSGASKLANSRAGNAVKAVVHKGVDVAKNAVTKSAEKNGLLSKVIGMLKKIFDFLSSKFTKLAAKKGAKEGVESGAKNIFKNALSSVTEAFTKKFPQISGKLSALFAADGALAATTAGIGNFIKNNVFSVAFGINEASNPRRLFRIPKGSKVDWKMRLIAAMWGAIKGHGVFGSLLDIANSIWQDNNGAGLFDLLSDQLYKLLCSATGDDKAAENLDKLQKEQLEKYEEYKEDKIREAYEKYLEENNLDEEDLSYEDYIAGVNDGKYPKPEYMSAADYNASQNKTIGAKIIDAGAKVWNVAKKGVKGLWGGVKKVAKVGWGAAKIAGKVLKNSIKYSPAGIGVRAISDIMTMNSKKEVKCWIDKDKNRIYVKDGKGFQVFNLKNNKYLDTISDKDEVAEINEAIENGDYEVSKFPVKYMKTMLRSVEAFASKTTNKVKGVWNSLFGKKKKKSKKKSDKERTEAKLQELKYGWFSKEDLSYYVENEDKTWSHYGADGNLITKIVDDEELAEFKLDRSLGKYTKQPITGGIKDVTAAVNKIKNIMNTNGDSTKELADSVVKKTSSVWDFFFGKDKKKKDKSKDKKDSGSGGETLFDMIKGQISGAGNNNSDDNESVNGFKYFSQYNKKWRDKNYSSGKNKGTVGSAGCGPASMSMVVSQLSGQNVTPDVMADYARQSGYRDEGGTNSKFMETAGSKYGINNTKLENPTSSEVISQIKKGNPVILNGISDGTPNSPYTTKGHYIVAVGVDSKGNVIVNDPRGKGFSGRVNPKVLDSQSRVGWVYSKRKKGSGGYGYGDKNGKIHDKGIIGKLKSKANKLFNLSGAGEDSDKDKVVKARQAVWAWMRAIENKLVYDQDHREDSDAEKGLTGTGSGDCSSTVRWAYHKALGSDFTMGSNTTDQCNKLYPWSDVVTFPSDEIDKNGTKNLCCGDLIYFHDENDNSKPCHVEMYIGAGEGKQIMGHGGGTDGTIPGPHYGTIAGYTKSTPVYCIKRLITEESVHGRTINFPNGVSEESSDAVVDSSNTTNTSDSTDSSSDNILTKWQSAFSEGFDKIATGATNYLMTGDSTNLTVDNTSTDSSENSTSSNGTTTYPEVDVATGDVPKTVWEFFTKLGYSKAATAGIMGNLQQESGFNPANIQSNGAGPAAGIAQWENYNNKDGRWLAMSNYAKSKGKDWTDLQSQLEYMDYELNNTLEPYFTKDISYGDGKGSTHANAGSVPISVADWKKSTNVDMATRQFEAGFERAGKPFMEKRVPAAQTYYNQFAGTSGSGGEDDKTMAMLDDYYQKFEDDISKDISGSGDDTFKYNGNIYDKQNYNRTDSLNRINQRNIINNNMNTTNMESLLSEVINVLNDIKSNTHDSYEALNKLPSSGNSNNVIVAGNRSSGTTNTSSSINRIKNKNYQLATKIALG